MSADENNARRLTPTERLHEVTMAALTRRPAPPEHGCEVTRNAKGVTQFTVTVRGYDLDDVIDSGIASYVKLDRLFPHPDMVPAANGDDERA